MKLLCFENTKKDVEKAERWFVWMTYIFELIFAVFTIRNFEKITSFDVGTVIVFSALLISALLMHFIPILCGIQINIIELNEGKNGLQDRKKIDCKRKKNH